MEINDSFECLSKSELKYFVRVVIYFESLNLKYDNTVDIVKYFYVRHINLDYKNNVKTNIR